MDAGKGKSTSALVAREGGGEAVVWLGLGVWRSEWSSVSIGCFDWGVAFAAVSEMGLILGVHECWAFGCDGERLCGVALWRCCCVEAVSCRCCTGFQTSFSTGRLAD